MTFVNIQQSQQTPTSSWMFPVYDGPPPRTTFAISDITSFMNNYSTYIIAFLSILVIILFIVILSSSKSKLNMSCTSCQKSKHYLKGAYLNYASTAAPKNGTLNPSDIGYSQNYDLRSEVESLKNQYKRLVNAPLHAKVIFNSGATESIANCVFWAKSYNQYGSVVGTKYDHSAVKANCDTYGLTYTDEFNEKSLMNNCAMVMLTQVNSKTGEILNVDSFNQNFKRFTFMNDSLNPLRANEYHPFNDKYTLQYRPIVALDASQSIGKVPIDMEKWGLNAVFFSLHKIGGPIGLGVLIINDTVQFPFKPLIAGAQQMTLRGGTLPMQEFVNCDWVLQNKDDANLRKAKWNEVMDKLKKNGLKVYEPKNKHLYNTFLICVKGCPLKTISKLASEGIYVGNVSACKNEDILNKIMNEKEDESDVMDKVDALTGGDIEVSQEDKDGSEWDNSIRISFSEADELDDGIVDAIIRACKE